MSTDNFSLIMTVLNEAGGLPAFLESLDAQSYSPAEVVIVDGGSTDNTVSILNTWASSRPDLRVKVIVVEEANISEGRNIAISESDGPWVAITDAGTLLAPRWLEFLGGRRGSEVDVIAGFFEPAWETRTGRILASITMPTLDEIDADTFLPSSRSVMLLKSAWETIDGYPEWLDYCEDLVFDLALKQAGFRFAFEPDAIAKWSARPTIRAYAKQYYRYARGDGKAHLWTKRHALRYGAYSVGAVGLTFYPYSVVHGTLLIGFTGYCAKYFRRAWVRRPDELSAAIRLLLSVPVVVVVGDLAKMAGYPVGLAWHSQHYPGKADGGNSHDERA